MCGAGGGGIKGAGGGGGVIEWAWVQMGCDYNVNMGPIYSTNRTECYHMCGTIEPTVRT